MDNAVGGPIRLICITQVDDNWEVWTNRKLGAHCDGSYKTLNEAEPAGRTSRINTARDAMGVAVGVISAYWLESI